MVIYADTSFLFSLYVQDANTSRAAAFAGTLRDALIVTPLQRLELRNALRRSVFRGDIADTESRQVLTCNFNDRRWPDSSSSSSSSSSSISQ